MADENKPVTQTPKPESVKTPTPTSYGTRPTYDSAGGASDRVVTKSYGTNVVRNSDGGKPTRLIPKR